MSSKETSKRRTALLLFGVSGCAWFAAMYGFSTPLPANSFLEIVCGISFFGWWIPAVAGGLLLKYGK